MNEFSFVLISVALAVLVLFLLRNAMLASIALAIIPVVSLILWLSTRGSLMPNWMAGSLIVIGVVVSVHDLFMFRVIGKPPSGSDDTEEHEP
jgi:hypothetical protein